MRNFVHNALRHHDAACGAVQLSLNRAGNGVRLSVRDFGPAVPADALPNLGQLFYRPDGARTRGEGVWANLLPCFACPLPSR